MKSTQHSLVCTSHTISFVYQHICAKYTSLHPGPQKSPLLWTCVEDMNSCKALSFRNVIYHGRKKPLTASLSVSNNELHIHRSEVRGHKRDCPPSLMQCGKLEPTCLDKIKQRLSLRSNRNKLCSQIPHPECTSLTSQPEERTTQTRKTEMQTKDVPQFEMKAFFAAAANDIWSSWMTDYHFPIKRMLILRMLNFSSSQA